MDLKYDGGHYQGKASLFLLAMTNSIGGLERIVPDAKLDDGKFTMIVVKTRNLIDMLQLITEALKGKHLHDPRIIYTKTNHLTAKPINSKMMINLEGEYGGDAPMEFTDLKQHIKMFANLDAMPKHVFVRGFHSAKKVGTKPITEKHFVKRVHHLFKF